ncbi:hypothetical protein Tco_0139261 [Tanacetum coccineum]
MATSIRLYSRKGYVRENIMKSIKEGPFHMGTVSDVIAGGTEGAVQQGPVRARSIPKDIYSLINHYTDAKDIWENVKMILEGSELTKDDRESQLYDEFEHFRQNKGETNSWILTEVLQQIYLIEKAIGSMTGNVVVQMRLNQGRPFQRNNTRGNGVAGKGRRSEQRRHEIIWSSMLSMAVENEYRVESGDPSWSVWLLEENPSCATTVTNVDVMLRFTERNDLALNVSGPCLEDVEM